jgi:glycosyltransferase involved in cell wall biosynthesis
MNAFLVSAVMPCLNEEETLGLCISKAQRCFRELGIEGQVVVADNGSTDRSVEIAEQLGAKVVRQPVRGYGAALMAGIEVADGEIIVIGDSDDSYDWSDIGPFIRSIQEGYDFTIGNRFKGGIEQGAMPPLHQYLGNPILSFIARVVSRAPVGDFHCGMRAFTKAAYRQMGLMTLGMEFASEMVINAARNGLRITEVPIRLFPDKRSRPPHLRSFRDGWRHLRFMMTYAPDHLFLIPGALMLILGLALQVILVEGPTRMFGFPLGIHFLALGSLLTLAGYNVLNLGVLGKVIVGLKHPKLKSRVAAWVTKHFSLERLLLIGGLLALGGIVADFFILSTWVRQIGESLEATVHPAFVASTAIVLGLNVMLSAFLLALLLNEERSFRSSGLRS